MLTDLETVLVPVAFEAPLEVTPESSLAVDFEPGEHITITKSAVRALQVAAKVADGGTVHLVHATPGLSRYGGVEGAWLSMTQAGQMDEAAREYAERVLTGIAKRLFPEVRCVAHAGPGKPSELILKIAAEVKPELIVLGASDHGLVRRVMSSTADRLIHQAHTMVLVVPPHPDA